MDRYEFVPATIDHALAVAAELKEADREEVWLSGHFTPEQACLQSLQKSPDPECILFEGKPLALRGVASITPVSDVGYPWMLATEAQKEHSMGTVRHARAWCKAMLERHSCLINFTYINHFDSLKFLMALGFTLHPARPFGVEKQLFFPFSMEA